MSSSYRKNTHRASSAKLKSTHIVNAAYTLPAAAAVLHTVVDLKGLGVRENRDDYLDTWLGNTGMNTWIVDTTLFRIKVA